MSQIAPNTTPGTPNIGELEEPKLSALKMSAQGQITLSKDARDSHKLAPGATLLEISLPGCIILLPQSQIMGDLMLRAQAGLKKLGLSSEELQKRVTRRSEEKLAERYPGVFDE